MPNTENRNGDGQLEVVGGCGEREGRSSSDMREIEAEFSPHLNDKSSARMFKKHLRHNGRFHV